MELSLKQKNKISYLRLVERPVFKVLPGGRIESRPLAKIIPFSSGRKTTLPKPRSDTLPQASTPKATHLGGQPQAGGQATTYSWDANGNMTQSVIHSTGSGQALSEGDPASTRPTRLDLSSTASRTRRVDESGEAEGSEDTTTFEYDALGRRISN